MAVTQPFVAHKDFRGGVPATPFPAHVNHRTLTTVETETVPSGAGRVVITADADIWLSVGTAVVPTADVVDGTGSFLLKAGVSRAFLVNAAQALSVVSASGTAHVSFEYFKTEVTF